MRPRPRTRPTPSADVVALVEEMTLELVPMGGVDAAVAALAPGSSVTVTCSPVRGIGATQELTLELRDLGHRPVPHLAARMVAGREHVGAIATWLRSNEIHEAFVIAGDASRPHGPYADAMAFLRDLLDHDTGLTRVGVASYPDGHPFVDGGRLRAALLDKQSLLGAAGIAATTTTQMCFDADGVARWLRAERAAGLTMPVDLGVPGVVDRARLLSLGVRLGVGTSLRFLRKHRATMASMIGGYDPSGLVSELVAATAGLGVSGLHAFTFNSVGATEAWRRDVTDITDINDGDTA